MPRRYSSSSSQPALDRPRLIPHAGLPGQDGTTRFAYSMEAVGAARDAFKLIPLLPTPLSSSSAAAGTSSTFPAVAAAIGGGKGGEATSALSAGVGATLGDTSGVQVGLDLFFFCFTSSFLLAAAFFFCKPQALTQPPRPLNLRKKIKLNRYLRARPRAGRRPRGRTPRRRRRAARRRIEEEEK